MLLFTIPWHFIFISMIAFVFGHFTVYVFSNRYGISRYLYLHFTRSNKGAIKLPQKVDIYLTSLSPKNIITCRDRIEVLIFRI